MTNKRACEILDNPIVMSVLKSSIDNKEIHEALEYVLNKVRETNEGDSNDITDRADECK